MLIPGVAPVLAAVAGDLVEACRRAVGTLRSVDRVLVVVAASGPGTRVTRVRPRRSGAGSAGVDFLGADSGAGQSPTPFGRSDLRGRDPDHGGRSGLSPSNPEPVSPGQIAEASTGGLVGLALLSATGIGLPCSVALAAPGDAADWGIVADTADRIGVLVIADASGCRGADSPGGRDDRAPGYDQRLASAFRSGDPGNLAAAVAAAGPLAPELLVAGLPALSALAELARPRGAATADLLYDGAPFGVGYLVGTWQWPSDG